MHDEPSRQVHLDFHTSELIPGIGADFSRGQFQRALKAGHVELINVFAKCHHGWSYYPTRVGKPHPHLKIDLLGEQIAACHEIGVRAPVYYTVGWSAADAETHPDWCVRTSEGKFAAANWDDQAGPDTPKPPVQWKELCPSGDYHALIRAQTEEICRLFPVDGFWYDIYHPQVACYCARCRRGMAQAGLDPARPDDVDRFRALTIERHCEDLSALIRGIAPEASIYFNGLTAFGRPQNFKYRLYRWNTKNDLEDLPTTWGGYDKFPLRAKRFLKEGRPIVAMSGKFHTSWGEFGGFKHPEALRYEAASMIAFGSRCNFGDQMHPRGAMDMTTYENIGHAFAYVERIERLGIGGRPAASLGLWLANDLPADEGTARMLLEEHLDFDVAGPDDDLSRFEALVVPSVAGALDGARPKVASYVAAGGRLLLLGSGLLDASQANPLPEAGVDYLGAGRFDVDYTVAAADVAPGLPASPFLNYEAALRLRARKGTDTLAAIREPYFSRTYGAYCGHQNTPYRQEDAAHPAVARRGPVIACAHALDRLYYAHGAWVHRALFAGLLRSLHARPMVRVEMPSAGRVSLLHFPDRGQYVLHLLYAAPLQRGRCAVIEDLPPLRGVRAALRLPVAVRRLTLEPDGGPLDFEADATTGEVRFVVPEFSCHCAVVAG